MKKGKKIWNRLLSLLLCLVVVAGMFAGIGLEAKAAEIPAANAGEANGYKNHSWVLTPGNTGNDFYNNVKEHIHKTGYNPSIKDKTYITTSQYGRDPSKGFFWETDCKTYSFTNGRYYVYDYLPTININTITRQEHIVDITVGYSLGVAISGASGSVALNGNTYTGGSFTVGENSGVTFTVNAVTDYTPRVTFDGKECSKSGSQYTISASDIKNASDRTIRVHYELTNGSTITVTQPTNGTITFNGSKNSPQTVGKSGTYNISATAGKGTMITNILVDGVSIKSGFSETLTVDWKPSNSAHTITAAVEKLELKAREGSINLRDEMNPKEIAGKVFDAIYDENSNIEADASNLWVDFSAAAPSEYVRLLVDVNGNMYVYSYGGYVDFTPYFGDEETEPVQLVITMPTGESYYSEIVNVDINKIKITAKKQFEKIYDGTPISFSTAVTNNPDFEWTGNVGNVTSLEIAGHYDSGKQPLNSPPTNAGTYYIKVKATDSLGSNTSDFIEYKISKRPVTITTNDKTYDFGEEIALDEDDAVVQGLLTGHSLTFDVVPSTTNATTNGSVNVTNVKVLDGMNDITGNYQFQINKGTLVIDKISEEQLKVELPETVEYNGQERKPLVITLDGKALIAGEAYTAAYSNNKNAGTATVVVTSDNWDGEITRTFNIAQKALTVSVSNADEIYDGTKTAENAQITLSGVVENDDVRATADVSFADPNVGTNKTVTASNIRISGSAADNYKLTNESTVTTAVISPRQVTIKAVDKEKIYGDPDPEFTYEVSDNTTLVNGENLTRLVYVRSNGEDVGEYSISLGQEDGANANYAITFKPGKLTIKKAPLTIKPDTLSKVYGEADPDELTYTVVGLKGEDTEAVLQVGSLSRAVGETVGDYVITCTGFEASNYEITYTDNVNFTILPKELVVHVVVKNKKYDGTTDAEFEEVELRGVLEADEVKVTLNNGVPVFANKGRSTKTRKVSIEFTTPFSITGEGISNYRLTQPSGIYATIKAIRSEASSKDKETATIVSIPPAAVDAPLDTAAVPTTSAQSVKTEQKDIYESTTVPVSGEENTVYADVTVEHDAVYIQPLDQAELDHILGEDVETGVVEIDLTVLEQEVNEVNLPIATLLSIVEAAEHAHNDTEALAIHFSKGTVLLDGQTMRAVVEAAHGETIHLVLDHAGEHHLNEEQKDALKEHDVHGNVEAYFICTDSGRRISDFEGGMATLSIPFDIPEGCHAAGFSVYYVDEDGNMEKLNTWYENGRIVWEVGHFSDFVIIYDEATAKAAESEKEIAAESKNTEDIAVENPVEKKPGFPWWIVIIVIAAAGVIAVIDKKRKENEEV